MSHASFPILYPQAHCGRPKLQLILLQVNIMAAQLLF